MTFWELFYLLGGLSLGTMLGFFICAILTIGSDADDRSGQP